MAVTSRLDLHASPPAFAGGLERAVTRATFLPLLLAMVCPAAACGSAQRGKDGGAAPAAAPARDAGAAARGAPRPSLDPDALVRCFARAHDGSLDEREAAIARCEAMHFGTRWRTEPAGEATDGDRDASAPTMSGEGRIDRRLVHAVVRSQRDAMLACFAQVRYRGAVSMRVRFLILPDGKSHGVSIDPPHTAVGDPHVVACVLGKFDAMRFPRPEGGELEVLYPFFLAAGGGT